MSNTDISSSINTIISTNKETGTVKTKRISDTHHTFGDLYARERVLFRLITCCYPRLAFKSLSHYDEENDPMFNGDFMVGLYTPNGPISYHFKLEFLDDFSHIEFSPRGPRYDYYTEKEKSERINTLCEMIIAGKTEDDIISTITNNPNLDDSLKPKQLIK